MLFAPLVDGYDLACRSAKPRKTTMQLRVERYPLVASLKLGSLQVDATIHCNGCCRDYRRRVANDYRAPEAQRGFHERAPSANAPPNALLVGP